MIFYLRVRVYYLLDALVHLCVRAILRLRSTRADTPPRQESPVSVVFHPNRDQPAVVSYTTMLDSPGGRCNFGFRGEPIQIGGVLVDGAPADYWIDGCVVRVDDVPPGAHEIRVYSYHDFDYVQGPA